MADPPVRALDYQAILESSADMVLVVDELGKVRYASSSSVRVTGHTPEELVGSSCFENVHDDDRPCVLSRFTTVSRSDRAAPLQYRSRNKQGEWSWLECVAVNQLTNPAVKGIVVTVRDITERIDHDQRRRQQESNFIELQKSESLGTLAGGVAHDFNNILAIILGEANLLRTGGPDNREVGRAIENAASRATELTRLLLAYAGRGQYEIEPTHLADLVVDVHPLLQMSAVRGAKLEVEASQSLPPVEIDRTQIRQVLLNLVQNAFESLHGRPGTVRVKLYGTAVTDDELECCIIRSQLPAGSVVCLEVSDTGRGMAPNTINRIFDPFYSTRRAGRGLGLAAVAGIVRGHRCALSVQSLEGSGSMFRLYFAPSLSAARPMSLPDSPTPVPRLSGRALIVDDEPMTARSTKRLAERLGLVTDQAWDGEDALTRFGARLTDYAVVILDMVMPRLNGVETFERLRALHPELPVVFYSGFDDNMSAPCLTQPRTAFVAKPFTAQRLVEAIKRATGH